MCDADGTMRRPADRNLHFVIFDKSSDLAYKNYLGLAHIIRRRTFVDELGVPCEIEFDCIDADSRHSLGLYGDAPVCYARWRIDEKWAVVDRLCTLQGYRHRGVARSCLENIIKDVCLFASRSNLPLSGLIVLVPQSLSRLQQKLAQANFFPLAEPTTEHLPSTPMCLVVSPTMNAT